MRAVVRAFTQQDLSAVLQLWDAAGYVPRGDDGLSVDEAVELIGSEQTVTVLAEADGRLIGMAIGTASAPTAWIHRVAMVGDVADQLLDSLEAEFTERGARRVASVAPGLERRGYQSDPALVYVERELPPVAKAPHAITRLGGRIIGPGLWDELRGLEEAKELIERRVILPLAEPGLAPARPRSPRGSRRGWAGRSWSSSRHASVRARLRPWSMPSTRSSNSRPSWRSSTRSRTSRRCARRTAA